MTLLTRLRNLLSLFSPAARRVEPLPVGAPLVRPYPWERSYPANISWDLELEPRPLSAILEDSAARFGDRPCLHFFGRRYTYREVDRLVSRVAKGLQQMGVGKGTRVGLFLPNTPFYVIFFQAILRAGGTVVNFNPLYAEREIARQINDAELATVVTMNLKTLYEKIEGRLEDTCLEKVIVCRMSDALPFIDGALFRLFKSKEVAAIPNDARHLRFEKLIENDGKPAAVTIDPARDVAVLQFTGGTTGIPKGAMLTHANLYANTVQIRLWAHMAEAGREKVLGVLPLFHVFGMTAVMNLGLLLAAEIVLLPRFKLAETLKIIAKEKPTVLLGVPTIYSAINGNKERERYDLSSLKYCISGGAPLPVEIKKTFEEITGCTLVEGYGLTEAGPVCTINPLEGLNKPGSIGLPIPGTVIDIVSLEAPHVPLPIGERGEIRVAGPQVMAGYLNQEAETAEVFADGRLRTGDVGYMDEDGYVYIIDRIKDLILSGGFNVYPRMVEEAIYLHPAVAEAAVCGVPHRHRGEIVKAFVKLRDGESIKSSDLKTFLKDKLAPFEQPKSIELRDEIPHTLIGKASRRELIAEEIRKQKRAGDGAPETPAPSEEGSHAA